jgi:serine/threonine protein kinase
MHSLNIIYRDLKIENLVLDEKGYIRLIDLGISFKLKGTEPCFLTTATLEYSSPETLTNIGHSFPSDWW